MTEWDATAYSQQSALQKWMADEHLASLRLEGAERVLDLGCGDGKITVEIADRVPRGSVLGVDPSTHMISFATQHFRRPNLEFALGDATRLPYRDELDLLVSFNALHWVTHQVAALQSIRDALRPDGHTFLEFVPRGQRRSIEDVLEDSRKSSRWERYFDGYRAPYVHFGPDEYRMLAEEAGLRVERIDTELKRWDFKTHRALVGFARATFVEWTSQIPEHERLAFIDDVLARYRRDGGETAEDANVFSFYQMEVVLRRA